ncbi:ammonia-dependent NAD(+) synthetase [Companilactobacillus allii]|uniref:NH(3)-dependent NAD(+) synthetase n=1 Tax=Companilactobacillus allii TaxID=1847728 RepID=A0A1P8Q2L1_9LACO|nr:ammonia-dependent NAD(+) synthetase [Companilactobacillus allii]APX72112.1 NAD(+) synthase [Companilactobacillus allii]USQ69206.1 ammonia-dependent NAD(+) synthetase [Companilactobacillus allii]
MRPLQKEIIAYEGTKPVIDVDEEIRRSVDFLKNYLLKNKGLKSLVLGISGGQDSTLAGRLSQIAMTELRDETGDSDYKFIAVRLPYGEQADESDAMQAIEWMQADVVSRVNIKASVDALVRAVEENNYNITDFNKGNIKARTRMIAQYAIAGDNKGVVVGTDHAAENITGFFTKFGDGAADITPLFRLDKRQGRALLERLNAPKNLYEKTPTADLEEDRPSLPDELALGVSYTDIDNYLEGKDIPEKSAEIIENWYKKTAHKRRNPYTVFDK